MTYEQMFVGSSINQKACPKKLIIFIFFKLLVCFDLYSQNPACNLPGQKPSTAIFLCDQFVYKVDTLPYCIDDTMNIGGCGNVRVDAPFYFRFRCYRSGTFGFRMRKEMANVPNSTASQQWAVYDITGKNPDDAYNNPGWRIMYNVYGGSRAGHPVYNGAAPFGKSPFFCDLSLDTLDGYCSMLNLKAGREYLLLVFPKHGIDAGFTIEFAMYNSTAVVLNPGIPSVKNTQLDCENKRLRIVFDRPLRSNTLTLDGSDFFLSAESRHIISATAKSPQEGYMDTVELTFNEPLPPGDYSLFTQKGLDGNTLLDGCGKELTEDTMIKFKVLPARFVDMGTVSKTACSPDNMMLSFEEPVRCNSISADGSDFKITGPSVVNITRAEINCVKGYTNTVKLFFDRQVSEGGQYQIEVASGNDNNTLLGECGIETPSGRSVAFTIAQGISAAFNYSIHNGCSADTVYFSHSASNTSAQWAWSVNGAVVSQAQSFSQIFRQSGEQSVQLSVSNAVCTSTSTARFVLNEKLRASFDYPQAICPQDKAEFKDRSKGQIKSWLWNFDNGYTSNLPSPAPQKLAAEYNSNRNYIVRLTVTDFNDCTDTAKRIVATLNNCYITVPNAFTPNHDGNNDWLYPLNTYKARSIEFVVYNRYGQGVFRSNSRDGKWDGAVNGQVQPPGIYIWVLSYTDTDSGKKVLLKGTTMLIR